MDFGLGGSSGTLSGPSGDHSTGWGDGDGDSLEQLLLDPDLQVMDIEGALDALGAPSPKAPPARSRAAERMASRASRLETLADVRAAAQERWLTNDEVLDVLTHARGRFGMPVQEKPTQQPPSPKSIGMGGGAEGMRVLTSCAAPQSAKSRCSSFPTATTMSESSLFVGSTDAATLVCAALTLLNAVLLLRILLRVRVLRIASANVPLTTNFDALSELQRRWREIRRDFAGIDRDPYLSAKPSRAVENPERALCARFLDAEGGESGHTGPAAGGVEAPSSFGLLLPRPSDPHDGDPRGCRCVDLTDRLLLGVVRPAQHLLGRHLLRTDPCSA